MGKANKDTVPIDPSIKEETIEELKLLFEMVSPSTLRKSILEIFFCYL